MSSTPAFASIPVTNPVTITTGDTSRTAPTAGGAKIFTPATGGGLCERINVIPLATTTASVLRIFKWDGTNAHLYKEFVLPAQTVTTGAPVADMVFSAVSYPEYFPIEVPAGWSITATINDAQAGGVKVHGSGGGGI